MMQEHYVTLFDDLFLPQGLALHESLMTHGGDFCLWILCVNDKAFELLRALNLDNVKLIELSKVETDVLKRLRAERGRGEFCWTLTPFAPKFVFDLASDIMRVTYLDADLFFLRSPSKIFNEFDDSEKSVMITDHAYDVRYDKSYECGRFCVQFMVFKNDDAGEAVRQHWEDQCVEWCYDIIEPDRFGDQKYLDAWPMLFEKDVHILAELDAIQAPWNASIFTYSRAIAWHFHGLRLLESDEVLLYREYDIPDTVDKYIYRPYVDILRSKVRLLGQSFVQGRKSRLRRKIRLKLCYLLQAFLRIVKVETVVKL